MLIAGNTPEENFRTLHAAGCIQTFPDLYTDVEKAMEAGYKRFCHLMFATQLNLCDTCPARGGCHPYSQFNIKGIQETAARIDKYIDNEARIRAARTPNNGPFGSMSVKQIAKEYNTSISQVRRLKVQGKLDTLLEKKEQCT